MRRTAGAAAALGGLLLSALSLTPAAYAAEADPDGPGVQSWWYELMDMQAVHEQATGEGVVVAVIDEYLDPDVPDLQGADVTVRKGCQGTDTPRVTDERADHGTAMTTLIAGQGTGNAAEGRGVVGVAPDATVRFYSLETDSGDEGIDCDERNAGELIVRAARDGADVINVSASGYNQFINPWIRQAQELGAVVVAAGGALSERNDLMLYPAATPGVVAVLAGDRDGKPWADNPRMLPFDNEVSRGDGEYGMVTLTAPGVGILAGGFPPGSGEWASGAERTGTSGAAALTSGAFAVLKSRYPDATANQLIQAMIHRSEDGEVQPLTFTPSMAFGLLNLHNALELDPRGYPDENPLLKPTARQVIAAYSESYDPDLVGSGSQESGSAGSGGGQASAAEESAGTAGESSGSGDEETAGPPVGALLAGALIALLVLGGAVVLARRRQAADAAAGHGAGPGPSSNPGSNASTNPSTNPGEPGVDEHKGER